MFNENLLYKRNLNETIERLNDFYSGKRREKIYAQMRVPSSTLFHYYTQHSPGETAYPNPHERIVFWDQLLAERQDIEDDSMPCCYLSEFDQGIYAGLLGAEIRFLQNADGGWISSMAKPFIDDLELFVQNLPHSTVQYFNRENHWYKTYLNQLQIFRHGSAGKFGVSNFILIDSFNLLIELRGGTNAYQDAFDHPDAVRGIIDFSLNLNIWVQETFFKEIGLFWGGTFSHFGQWVKGKIVSESVDPFHLTSVSYFDQWGKEPVARILSHFDGGFIHLHSNGRHLLKSVASIPKIKGIYLLDEPGYPPAIEDLAKLDQMRGSVPLIINVSYPTFAEYLKKHQFITNVFYIVDDVPSISVANHLMGKVRNYH